jgi:hypothetical protein
MLLRRSLVCREGGGALVACGTHISGKATYRDLALGNELNFVDSPISDEILRQECLSSTIEECRSFYAQELRFAANPITAGLVDALAKVPREKFLAGAMAAWIGGR